MIGHPYFVLFVCRELIFFVFHVFFVDFKFSTSTVRFGGGDRLLIGGVISGLLGSILVGCFFLLSTC